MELFKSSLLVTITREKGRITCMATRRCRRSARETLPVCSELPAAELTDLDRSVESCTGDLETKKSKKTIRKCVNSFWLGYSNHGPLGSSLLGKPTSRTNSLVLPKSLSECHLRVLETWTFKLSYT